MARLIQLTAILLIVMGLTACATPADKARTLLDLKTQADTAYQEGNCQTAIKLYRRLANRLDEKSHALLRLGNCQARTQRNAESMDTYREALQHDPGFVKAWFNLIYVQTQILSKTVVDMSANVDPTDPAVNEVRTLAARILAAFEQPDTAPKENKPAEPNHQVEKTPADEE
jgi:tetratricopeptide (TPR) repeat protein